MKLSTRLRNAAEQLAADVRVGTYDALGHEELYSINELSLALARYADDAAELEEANRPVTMRELSGLLARHARASDPAPVTHRERAVALFGERPTIRRETPADVVWIVGMQ